MRILLPLISLLAVGTSRGSNPEQDQHPGSRGVSADVHHHHAKPNLPHNGVTGGKGLVRTSTVNLHEKGAENIVSDLLKNVNIQPPKISISEDSVPEETPKRQVHPLIAIIGEDKFVQWYSRFLDLVINDLLLLSYMTDNPSEYVLDRVACANGFNSFARHIGSPWAIHMLDSASKIQSGLLMGNMNDLGQYDECVRVSVAVNKSDPFTADFTGQHCLVSFNFHLPNNTITLDGKETKLIELFGADWIPLTLGQCYPSLCKPHVLQEVLNNVLSVPDNALALFGLNYAIDVTVAANDCHVKEREDYDALDYTVGVIILFFILVAGFCSTFDYYYIERETRNRQAKPHEEIMLAFSAYTNGRKLLDTTYPADAMTALNGMKVFSIAWVVLGHRYRYLINQPLVNLLDFPTELGNWPKQILFSGPLSVDTFFLISGLLNMYSFAIMREKVKRFTPVETILAYIHRYLRLTPSYIVMIGVTATWLYRAGDGPYWDRMVGTARESCRESYWENLIYLNNYLNPSGYCMMQSWYLSADMQMFWLSPFVVYPLWRWPIFGFIEIAILTIASILSPMLVSYFYEIKAPIPLTTDTERGNNEMAYLYLPTHTKTVSYVVGILAGYLLYNFRREKIKFNPSKVTLTFFWLASAAFMLFAMFGGYTLYQRDDNYSKIYSAFYIGFYRFFWAIGLVWIMIACITGYGGPINTLLSWPPLGPIARLTYCIYLTHVAIILRGVASQRLPVYFGDYNQVEQYLGDLVISIGSAAVLSLLFEAPMMKIEKIIFGGGFKKRPRPRATNTETHTHTA